MCFEQLTTIAAIEQFLAGTQEVAISLATSKQERYRWIQKVLVKLAYPSKTLDQTICQAQLSSNWLAVTDLVEHTLTLIFAS